MNVVRMVLGMTLVMALGLGLGTMAVSAQQPTPVGTPGTGPGVSPTGPAGAPPVAAGMDDPAQALDFGTAVRSIPANSAGWFKFHYAHAAPLGGVLSDTSATIWLLNRGQNGPSFQIYRDDNIQNWSAATPVGTSSPMTVNCRPAQTGGAAPGAAVQCAITYHAWNGELDSDKTYYLRINNNTNEEVTPQLIMTGTNLTQCDDARKAMPGAAPPTGPGTQAQTMGQGFAFILCQPQGQPAAPGGTPVAPIGPGGTPGAPGGPTRAP